MNELVRLNNNIPVVSTFDLFVKMGYSEHRTLKRVVSDHVDEFREYGFLHLERQKPKGVEGGRPVEAYLLNEDQFILLVMLAKNSKESVALKYRVAKEFKRLRDVVSKLIAQRNDSEWQNVRKDGKAVYMQKTEVIKQFVDYATKQGSKNAKMYYANLAKMENGALFFLEQKYKNVREILTIKQLMQVATADDVIEKALKEGMDKGLSYKKCYTLAKERVISFAEIIGKSPVQGLLDKGETNELGKDN